MSMMDWLEGRDREIADDQDRVEEEVYEDFDNADEIRKEDDRDELAHEAEWGSFINDTSDSPTFLEPYDD